MGLPSKREHESSTARIRDSHTSSVYYFEFVMKMRCSSTHSRHAPIASPPQLHRITVGRKIRLRESHIRKNSDGMVRFQPVACESLLMSLPIPAARLKLHH